MDAGGAGYMRNTFSTKHDVGGTLVLMHNGTGRILDGLDTPLFCDSRSLGQLFFILAVKVPHGLNR